MLLLRTFILITAFSFLMPIYAARNNNYKQLNSYTPSSQNVQSNKKGKININTANVESLVSVKGIGNKRAQAIINYRNEHNGFKSVDELAKVKGIGEKRLEKLTVIVEQYQKENNVVL